MHATCTSYFDVYKVWAGPSWSSIALRYDVAFFWSIIRSITILPYTAPSTSLTPTRHKLLWCVCTADGTSSSSSCRTCVRTKKKKKKKKKKTD
jgi:hypothetical protein